MKLIVKSKAIFSKGGWTSWDVASYYRRLTLDEYIRGRIYPVNRDYLDRATTIVRMARAAGKVGRPMAKEGDRIRPMVAGGLDEGVQDLRLFGSAGSPVVGV